MGTIKTEDELLKAARSQDAAGDRSLMGFMLSRRDLVQLIAKVHRVEDASRVTLRSNQTRIEILTDAAHNQPCTCKPDLNWSMAADQVLQFNGFNRCEVQVAVLNSLILGRGKKRNIFIIGDTNRAKSFLLKPLSLIFQSFVPPDSGSHQLADIKGSELIWLNDWTYDPLFIPWNKTQRLFGRFSVEGGCT